MHMILKNIKKYSQKEKDLLKLCGVEIENVKIK